MIQYDQENVKALKNSTTKGNERESLARIAKDIVDGRKERSAKDKRTYTQRDLANEVGTTQTSIRRLEGGETNVSFVVMVRAAKVLGLPLEKLLEHIQPESELMDRTYKENAARIAQATSAMGLEEEEIDFSTKRALLQMLKLWPK